MDFSSFGSLAELQGMILLFLLIGIFARKTNIITKAGNKSLMNLIIDIILPCNIINSFNVAFSISILYDFGIVFIIAISIQVMCMLMSKFFYNRVPGRRKAVLQYATVCSNAGFMGNPIAESVFGSMGLLYASIYLIPLRVVMWSAGISYFTNSKDRKSAMKKVATHPCIIAVYIGLFLMFTGIHLPGFAANAIKSIGGSTTSLSMIVIGTILAEVNFKRIVNKTIIAYSALRLIIIPFIVLIACKLFSVNSLLTGVSVVLAGMPAGSTTAILASKYGGDEKFATKCVVFTTVLSLITIPVWCMILKR